MGPINQAVGDRRPFHSDKSYRCWSDKCVRFVRRKYRVLATGKALLVPATDCRTTNCCFGADLHLHQGILLEVELWRGIPQRLSQSL